MPEVKMPDGTIVEMPDKVSPEQAARLRAMSVPGFTDVAFEAQKQEDKAKKDWLGTRDRLSLIGSERRAALKEVDSPEKLAIAYGFKPDQFNKDELWKAYVSFKAQQQPGGAFDSFTQGLSRMMPFGGDTQPSRLQDWFGQRKASGDPQARALADLRARMNEETYQTSTEGHPVSSFAGEALGATPTAMLFPASIPGAAAAGATMSALTPNLGSGSDWVDTLYKTGSGAAVGGAGAAGLKWLTRLGTKGVAAARGQMPAEFAARQARVTEALGGPEADIAAADLVPSLHASKDLSKIVQDRNAARLAGSERVLGAEERNLQALNRRATGIESAAKTETAATPFSRQSDLVGPLQPGEVIQESLPIERGYRQREIVTPAYEAAEAAIPADGSRTNTGQLVSQFERMIQEMQSKGAGSIYTHPMASVRGEAGPTAISTLETQLGNIRGSKPTAAQAPQLQYSQASEPIVKAMRANGATDADIASALKNLGHPAELVGGAPASTKPAVDPFDTVQKLLDVRDNLEAARGAYGASNDQTHFIQQAIKAVDEHLAPYLNTPEWRAALKAKATAKATAAQQTMPYHGETVEGLLPSLPNRAENVTPQTALNRATGLDVGKTRLVNSLMEDKGQAALREGLLSKAVGNATNPAMPQGIQINPSSLASEISGVLEKGVLKPEQASELSGLLEAIQTLQSMGSRHVSPGAMMDQGIVAAASDRSALKFLSEWLAKRKAPMQYSPRGKAWLLTPSALNDPALKGTALQKFLQFVQSKAPALAYTGADSATPTPVLPEE